MRVVRGPESYGLSRAIVAARYIFTTLFFVNSAVVRPFDNGFALAAVPNNLLKRIREDGAGIHVFKVRFACILTK